MKAMLKKFVKDEQGLETVEYAVLVALILVVLIAGVAILGPAIQRAFTSVDTAIP